MSTISLGPQGLLQYQATHCILICRECEYAIQKSAIESHLLKHKIYRVERQNLLNEIGLLKLPEPENVAQPAHGTFAIELLPVLDGFRCTEGTCEHLSISTKRIRSHWSEIHGSGKTLPALADFTRPVKMQTFFRGNKLRYFEVDATQSASNKERNALDAGPEFAEQTTSNSSTQSKPVLDLVAMRYFHHFSTTVAPTLPGSVQRWRDDIVIKALQIDWLMFGLLAISARHQATLTAYPTEMNTHIRNLTSYHLAFMKGMDDSAGRVDSTISEIANQIRSLLAMTKMLADIKQEPELESSCNPFVLISLMRIFAVSASRMPVIDTPELRNEMRIDMTPKSQCLLDQLNILPGRMSEVYGRPNDVKDVFTMASTMHTLVDCCMTSFASARQETIWDSATLWLTEIPEQFHEMLARHDTTSVIVMAFWAAILVKRAETAGCWYIQGMARTLVRQSIDRLSTTKPEALILIEKLVEEV